jgi:hypothetical protein
MLVAALTRDLAFQLWLGCLEYGLEYRSLEASSEFLFCLELVLASHDVGCDQTLGNFAKR